MTPEHKQQMGEMAERWYGYGRWEAPFWFLGPEPGGDSPDSPLEAWCKLGKGELLDCKEHHLAFGFTDWHNRGRLQPTWAKLMLLLQSFKAQDCSAETRKRYQTEMWGSKSGETCVIELCPVAAPALGIGSFDDSAIRKRRIAQIQDRIQTHQPRFLVLYSRSHIACWEQVVGGRLPSIRACGIA